MLDDPSALDSGYYPCSYDVLAVTRKRILATYDQWWSTKREYYTSDAEMEEAEVSTHVDGSSEVFRFRVSGRGAGSVDLKAWPCDLALYVLNTDILIVLLDAQRVDVEESCGSILSLRLLRGESFAS